MTKANLEHEINNWLQSEFVDENKILVEEIFYKKNLSKENNERLRHVNNIDLLDFVTDYAVLVNVNNKYEILDLMRKNMNRINFNNSKYQIIKIINQFSRN